MICNPCRIQSDINSRLPAAQRIAHQCDNHWKRVENVGVTKTRIKIMRRLPSDVRKDCVCQCRISDRENAHIPEQRIG